MTYEDLEKIKEKCKKQKNGIYSFKGKYDYFKYGVKNHYPVLICINGSIRQIYGGITVDLGKIKSGEEVKEMKRLLKDI